MSSGRFGLDSGGFGSFLAGFGSFRVGSDCFGWFQVLSITLPKYICSNLLHDSTGLPYVKDRLLSCATKFLDRITQNPLVEESISRNRLNPAWDRFPTPLSVVRPGQSSVQSGSTLKPLIH